jgi:hypothetical protein
MRDDTVSIRRRGPGHGPAGMPADDQPVAPTNRAVWVAGQRRARQAATRVPPGVRCPGPGIMAVVIWKACCAVVRRCRCRLRRPGGRPAGPARRAAPSSWRGGARSRAGDPAAGRRDGAAAAGPLALPVLQVHAHPVAGVVRAPARRCHRGDRHPHPAARYAPDMVADPAMRAISAAFPCVVAVSIGPPFAAGWATGSGWRGAGRPAVARAGPRHRAAARHLERQLAVPRDRHPPVHHPPPRPGHQLVAAGRAGRYLRRRHPHLRAPGLGDRRALACSRPPGVPPPRSGPPRSGSAPALEPTPALQTARR